MRRFVIRSLTLPMVLLVGGACVYPTERSAELRVAIDTIPDLVQGEALRLGGAVLDAAGDTVPNAELSYQSDNTLIAAVSGDTLLATSVGTTNVTATATGFAEAEQGVMQVRIAAEIQIDSVRPRLVRFGDTLRLFGTGLNPAPFGEGGPEFLQVGIGEGAGILKSYVPQFASAPNRFGRLTVWVSPPASPVSTVLALGVNGLAINVTDTVLVLQRDLFEPNDTVPHTFGAFDGPFRNPALSFERRPRGDSVGGDWYRFTQHQVRDRKVIVRSNDVGPETYQVFFTDSLAWNGAIGDFEIGPGSWTLGPSLYTCQGVPFVAPQFPADSVIIALRDLPVGTYDLIAAYTSPGAYELAVLPGYRSALLPDAAEENDICDLATPLSIGQTRSLTIDNPHDIDWFSFTVTASAVTAAFDVAFDVTEQEADLDIYVLRDFTPDSLVLVGVSDLGGTTDEVTTVLPPGDYFLVVVDFVGVPTAYTLTTGVAPTPAQASPPASTQVRRDGVQPMIVFRSSTNR